MEIVGVAVRGTLELDILQLVLVLLAVNVESGGSLIKLMEHYVLVTVLQVDVIGSMLCVTNICTLVAATIVSHIEVEVMVLANFML